MRCPRCKALKLAEQACPVCADPYTHTYSDEPAGDLAEKVAIIAAAVIIGGLFVGLVGLVAIVAWRLAT